MLTDNKVRSILVIEDNPGDFALVEEFLSGQVEVFTLLQSRSFREAREILTTRVFRFDVILLDLSLPDKTGIPLIREIVELSLNIPVIVLTGYTDISFGVKSLAMGVSDYILKDDLTPSMLYKSIVYSWERKKSTMALEESQKQYSELFHLSPQPMWVFDQESLRFLDVNKSAIKHYGYSRDEFLSMTATDICIAEQPYGMEQLSPCDMNSATSCSQGIFIHRKKNGAHIHVDIQSNNILFKGKKAKIILANDITERLNYIKAIEKQNEKLKEISWIQSHLVRAPVARILGLTQLINDMQEDVIEKEKMMNYLVQSANELDTIIKNITEKTSIIEEAPRLKAELSLQQNNYVL